MSLNGSEWSSITLSGRCSTYLCSPFERYSTLFLYSVLLHFNTYTNYWKGLFRAHRHGHECVCLPRTRSSFHSLFHFHPVSPHTPSFIYFFLHSLSHFLLGLKKIEMSWKTRMYVRTTIERHMSLCSFSSLDDAWKYLIRSKSLLEW